METSLIVNPCYAASLGGCDKKRSGEHYVSETLLRAIGDQIRVQGLPWCLTPRELPVQALTANVLCSRHNSLLSPLDDEAGRFFETLYRLHSGELGDFCKFDGAKIEQWMLKVLCGIVAAGVTVYGRMTRGLPPIEVVGAVFGKTSLADGDGLRFIDTSQFGIHPLEVQIEAGLGTAAITGIAVSFAGVPFRVGIPGSSRKMTDGIPRPSLIRFEGKPVCGITWRDNSDWVIDLSTRPIRR